ncbi:MAG TPA: hypothetical protein PLD79_01020 [Halothiobacillus sp.]|nr:hypothetical protein [Halothiobacillus sp.]
MNYNESRLFILRRCVWIGRATRADVLRAFPSTQSTATASRALDDAVTRWPNLLRRKPKWIELIPNARIPDQVRPLVDARCMMRLIRSDSSRFSVIGLTTSEVHFVQTNLRHDVLAKADHIGDGKDIGPMLDLILRTIILNARIDILYVGLRLGESARWRSVIPVALNDFQGQWRIIAHDLEADGFPIKSFVLPRILDAHASIEKTPRNLHLQTGDVAVRRYAIKLNPRMTADQKTAIGRELGINRNNEIMLSDDAVFDFRKTWMESELGSDLTFVWPLVVELNRVG